jgi:membrane associated rhomboid family serine protease
MEGSPQEEIERLEQEPLDPEDFRRETLWGMRLSRRPLAAMALCAILILFHALLSLVAGSEPGRNAFLLLIGGAKVNALLDAGEWWRLVSSVFLHATFAHLAVNCLGVLIAGWLLENFLGSFLFFAVFALSGVAGGVCSWVADAPPSAGASGGMFGLLGGTVVFGLTRFKEVPGILRAYVVGLPAAMAIFSFGYGLLSDSVDNYSHAGGFVAGAGLVLLVSCRWVAGSLASSLVARVAKAALLLAVLYAMAVSIGHLLLSFDLTSPRLAQASRAGLSSYYYPEGWSRGTLVEGKCETGLPAGTQDDVTCFVDPYYTLFIVASAARMLSTPVFAEYAGRRMNSDRSQYPNDTIFWAVDNDRGLAFSLVAFDDIADKYATLFAALRSPPCEEAGF